MRKPCVLMTTGLVLLSSITWVASYPASAKPDASASASKPLPGCQDSGPNVGAVTALTIRMSGEVVDLSWRAPQTRQGWSVTGYNVYKENKASGVMEYFKYSPDPYIALNLSDLQSQASGPVPVQVAAVATRAKASGGSEDEEGCRTGKVISGRAKVESSQTVTKSSWARLECQTLGNQMVFVVAGWFKANAGIVSPGAFSLAIVLSPARVQAGPVLGWTFQQFKDAVSGWTGDALDPAYEFGVTSLRCFRS